MAYVPTTISSSVGEKAVAGKPVPATGKGAAAAAKTAPPKPNTDDIKKIQGLLRKVFGASAPTFKDGVYDDAMKTAITDFQKLWGGLPDATVDPHGQTLKRLDRLANPLVLKPIQMTNVSSGGYTIAFIGCDGGALPGPGKGYTVHLCFPDDKNCIEVTDRPANDLLSKNNLGEVLEIFEKLNCWAKPVQCRVQLRYKGGVISTSDPQVLNAPVQPHNGKLLPLDEQNNGPTLTYQGDADTEDFHGRMFAQVPGYDKYVFVWAGKFETDNQYRGFDCITYAGTTCGASNSHMAESADLASSLGATVVEINHTEKDKNGKETSSKVKLEAADPAYVKEFFTANKTGYYLMYSSGHIVIVADGSVYEFKASTPSGYNCTPVLDWLAPYKSKKLTVRKLASKPARAV